MQLAALPDATEARITGLVPGAVVGLALGLEPGRVPVPGGAVLSLVPISMSPSVIADGHGRAMLRVRYPVGSSAGLAFLAQAVVHDPRKTIGTAGSVTTLPVRQGIVPRAGDEADIVLFFGQSNCEGWASVAHLPVRLQGPHPMLRIWNGPVGEWQAVEAGRNTNMNPTLRYFGAEIGMADSLGQRADPLWLVKIARSPSSLGPTPGPGNEWGAEAGELYAAMLQRLQHAGSALGALGLVPRVRLICMMQGESDAANPELAKAYDGNLERLLGRLRSDLRALGLVGNELPWVRLGLVNRDLVRVGLLGAPLVRAAQATVAQALADCDTIETTSFALLPDRIHFDVDGLLQMGRRFVAGRI
ncbi:MAG: hypothetical protein KDE27_20695 [Planctomycetes bacterium]|nr:hypothetical protein [Planctomycetota bacterium]